LGMWETPVCVFFPPVDERKRDREVLFREDFIRGCRQGLDSSLGCRWALIILETPDVYTTWCCSWKVWVVGLESNAINLQVTWPFGLPELGSGFVC
jgi:hypothetical protein